MTNSYLRVVPTAAMGELPVPLGDGRKVTRAAAPPEGYLIADSVFVRRRIASGELELKAEGPAALPREPVQE
jgi:hypothetical protein